jgi:HEAT repeat protein
MNPYLTNALNDSSQRIRLDAIRYLRDFGEEAKCAVPRLVQMVNDPDYECCLSAIFFLGAIHDEPQLVIPALINVLYVGNIVASAKPNINTRLDEYGRNNFVRACAANALRNFGKDAKPAVPALLDQLKDPDQTLRQISQGTLKVIAPEAVPKE